MTKKKYRFHETDPTKALFHKPFANWDKDDDWNKNVPGYFKRLNKLTDDRAFVILAATILEYQIDSFLKCFVPDYKSLISDTTNFDLKIRIIKSFRLVPPQIIESADLIRKIRNEFAHNLQIDNFTDATEQSKLKKHLVSLDRICNEYKDEMYYSSNNPTYTKKFKDVWRRSFSGFRSYEKNILLFRKMTEDKTFIEDLYLLATKKEKERHKKQQE
jgi:hypothetical protein